ncbi:short-chain dehydrogenase/reductase (SDR) family protein [Tieghemostelium lacteum]|uniref:Short-chain dehydrogenase/reductase (SDR) family protein n=1 Tax=Tieghemostelium lacteum TaxID=361077 RepID=A0A151ZIR4_TIELA|nr:short-chain dehydrogenase/reductase (SDR) family protein [Tieghemostelium lacteum]|eukprot:KYQ93882.1 short-chain dehydrogenase/reductase (SDR) family protein [Tieghemostelium lacteum]
MINNNNNSKVWIITGCTSGTGLALAEKLIEIGHRVVGTSRDISKFKELAISKNDNFFGIQLDITSEKAVQEAISEILNKFGRIDVLVNNAGMGFLGSVEEVTDREHRDLFDVLYFGPLNLIRNILPLFRTQKSGHIFNISSTAGIRSFVRSGAYSGAKFALLGMSDSLHDDVKEFGVNVTCIVLGYFHTGFTSNYGGANDMIPEYDTAKFWKNLMDSIKPLLVPGDVKRFAEIVIETEKSENPPKELYIGPDSFSAAEGRIQVMQQHVDQQKVKNSDVSIKDWDTETQTLNN